MGLTKTGAFAILFVLAATGLNIVMFIMPAWSKNDTVNSLWTNDLMRIDFSAGLWGFCSDFELYPGTSPAGGSSSFSQYYYFHSPIDYNRTEINANFTDSFSDYSVCDGYRESEEASEDVLLEYSRAMAFVAGLDETTFAEFLSKSCGSLGNASIAFGAISMSVGALAVILLTLGIACCKTKSAVLMLGRVLTLVAIVSTLLTFILWLTQSSTLNDKDYYVGRSWAFGLSVTAAVLHYFGLVFVAAHRLTGTNERQLGRLNCSTDSWATLTSDACMCCTADCLDYFWFAPCLLVGRFDAEPIPYQQTRA